MNTIKITKMILGFCLLLSLQIISQTNKSTFLIDGRIGNIVYNDTKYNSQNSGYVNRYKNFYMYLSPSVGFFVSNRTVIGSALYFNLNLHRGTSYYGNNNSMSSYDLGRSAMLGLTPYVRYYVNKNLKNKIYTQLGAGGNISLFNNQKLISYSSLGQITSEGTTTYKTQTFYSEILVGLNHFFNDKVALNTAIGYGYSLNKSKYNTSYTFSGNPTTIFPESTLTSEIGSLIWNFGITIFLRKNKDESK